MTNTQAIIIATAIVVAGLLNGGIYERKNDYLVFNKFTGENLMN